MSHAHGVLPISESCWRLCADTVVCQDTELKARIEAFKAEKKGKTISMADVMDTSPD